MKKKQVLYIVLALIFSVLLLPKSVDAQGNDKVLTCEYNYKNNELIYEIYEDGKVNLPFDDGEKYIEKNGLMEQTLIASFCHLPKLVKIK